MVRVVRTIRSPFDDVIEHHTTAVDQEFRIDLLTSAAMACTYVLLLLLLLFSYEASLEWS